jgi:hypothetical protein
MLLRKTMLFVLLSTAACSGGTTKADSGTEPAADVGDAGTTASDAATEGDINIAPDVSGPQDSGGGGDAAVADMGQSMDAGCDGGACPDVDECADGTDNCDVNAICTNTDGGFSCMCNVGFNGDGTTCVDTGDCAAAPCADGGDTAAVCTEGATGYTCACTTGYSFNGATCADTDECAGNPCDDAGDAGGVCSDAVAPRVGYSCACGADFAPNGTTCISTMVGNAMSFFVSSSSPSAAGDGNLGGLAGADAHCQTLALSANPNDTRTWVAYLSTEGGAGTADDINAGDRIGTGPWYNADGVMFAADLAALHTIETSIIACSPGPATCLQDRADYVLVKPADDLFLDENGVLVTDPLDAAHLPLPNGGTRAHDIFTGTRPDGTLMPGATCNDWTSNSGADEAQVGHTDTPNNTQFSPSWNSAHLTVDCSQNGVRSRGGAGFVYCFTAD